MAWWLDQRVCVGTLPVQCISAKDLQVVAPVAGHGTSSQRACEHVGHLLLVLVYMCEMTLSVGEPVFRCMSSLGRAISGNIPFGGCPPERLRCTEGAPWICYHL